MLQIAQSSNGLGGLGDAQRPSPGPSVVNLAELVAILGRRRSLILRTMLAALIVVFAYWMLVKPTFVSSARLLIDPRGLQVVDRDLTPRGQGGEINLAVVESQMRVLTSDNVLMRVVQKLDLRNDPEFSANRGISGWIKSRMPEFLRRPMTEAEGLVLVLAEFRKSIKADRLQNSFIVDLSVTTEDRDKSARIANEIASVYTDTEITNREQLAMRTSDSLAGRLSELKTKVRAAEEAVERYKRQNNIVMTGGATGGLAGTATSPGVNTGGSLFSDQELAQLNQQLAQVRTQAAQAQARAEQIERVLRAGGSPDSIAEAVQSPTISQLRVRLSVAQQQVASLSADLMPGHPSMVAARARVADVNNEIRAELGRIARAARADLERARASERELSSSLDRSKLQRGQTDQARVQLRELEREADASRMIYEAFLVRARELGEQKSVDPTNARVISPAVAPTDPKGLRFALLLPLSLIFGLGLGSVLALARENLDPVIRTARHVEQATRLPVLTVVPSFKVTKGRNSLVAFVANEPTSTAAAAMRRLRAALGGSAVAGGPRTVLVTAIGEQDGKSTVALNMALAAAQGGESVLLIDADPVRHVVTSQRVGGEQTGFFEVVQDRARLDEAIVPDPSGLISLLPVGKGGAPRMRLSEPAVRRLLAEKCRNFDLVVVDGGIVGTDHLTSVIAAAVDDIVKVARADATRKEELAGAVAKLGVLQAKVRGIALMDF